MSAHLAVSGAILALVSLASLCAAQSTIHYEINHIIGLSAEATRGGRARSEEFLRRTLRLLESRAPQIGTDPQRLDAYVRDTLRAQQQYWQLVRAPHADQPGVSASVRIINRWFASLPLNVRSSPLVQYYRAAIIKTLNDETAAGWDQMDVRQADSEADLAAALQQLRRVFAARVRNPQNARFYDQQLDLLLKTSTEVMNGTHDGMWNSFDEMLRRMTTRWHRLVQAAEVIAI